MVQLREDIVGLDGAILMHPRVWEASGHVENFTDPLVECRNCRKRFRLDDLPKGDELATAWRAKKLDLSGVSCPNCGEKKLADPRQFNLMFKTFVGPVEDTASIAWLRPETAQSIFVDFENVQQSSRKKLPFGIAQVGKAFRNEITPGNFIFRSREFEQMEMQYFTRPSDAPRFYDEEPDKEGTRVVLRLRPHLAPYKVAVLPLSKNERLVPLAREVWSKIRPAFMSTYDETQAIGRRYRRQDEIGTPLCVTVDFVSLDDQQVTIRERDSMSQIRVAIADLVPALREKLGA